MKFCLFEPQRKKKISEKNYLNFSAINFVSLSSHSCVEMLVSINIYMYIYLYLYTRVREDSIKLGVSKRALQL
jgi:hypothetical protein